MRARWAGMVAGAAAMLLAITGCTAQPSGTTGPEPADGPVVAFYGDSYTLGTGASDPSHRWSTRICEGRGWQEVNPSMNGIGFVNNRERLRADLPGQVIAAEPDIVIVTMGLNDVFSYDRAGTAIHDQIRRDFARLKEALPDARFVVVEPFWYTEERPDSLETIIGWVEQEADLIGADHISGASRWIQGRAGEMASDGLHPNDAGYDLLTAEMDAALAGVGL